MRMHDLRRCTPAPSQGMRALRLACSCGHPVCVGDFLLLRGPSLAGCRYVVVGRENDAGSFRIEFSPRTMGDVIEQEKADARQYVGAGE